MAGSAGLGLDLAAKSTAGHDAVDLQGIRYQIKGRRITSDNGSLQLGAIRNLDREDFDFLIGVPLDENFKVILAVRIPHAVIGEYASYKAHTNAHVLHPAGA